MQLEFFSTKKSLRYVFGVISVIFWTILYVISANYEKATLLIVLSTLVLSKGFSIKS